MHKVGEVSGLEQCREIEVVCFLVLIVFLYKTTFRHNIVPVRDFAEYCTLLPCVIS